jgi:hypothetical protein
MNDKYQVQYNVESRQRAGGTGNKMGTVRAGFTFTPLMCSSGWLAIASNKWVPLVACKLIEDVSQDENPVEEAIEYPEIIRLQFPDGLGGWQEAKNYRIVEE